MPARVMNLGRTGLVLLLANEIRGALLVAALLSSGGGAGLHWRTLEAAETRATCSIAPALCGTGGAAAAPVAAAG